MFQGRVNPILFVILLILKSCLLSGRASRRGKMKDAREVHFEHRGPISFGVVNRRRASNCARVIDKDVETFEAFKRLFDQFFRRLTQAEIAADRMRYAAAARDAFASFRRRATVPMTRDLRACFSERDSDRGAQSSCCAGNQRDAILQLELVEN